MPSALSSAPTYLEQQVKKRNRDNDAKMRVGKDTAEQAQARREMMDKIANQYNKSGTQSALAALKKMGYGGPR